MKDDFYLQALWHLMPNVLNEKVGFDIETFGTTRDEKQYFFWKQGDGETEEEKANDFLNSGSKYFNKEKFDKWCFNKVLEIRQSKC